MSCAKFWWINIFMFISMDLLREICGLSFMNSYQKNLKFPRIYYEYISVCIYNSTHLFLQFMSEIKNFTTPLPKGDPTPFQFIVYGDMGVFPYPNSYQTAHLVRREVAERDNKFVFHIGDISYARGIVSGNNFGSITVYLVINLQ